MSTIYIVASLPRTGTTSLCKMAEIVGMKARHTSVADFPKDLKDGFTFFADTPYYDLGYLMGIFQHHKNIKVIYSMREPESLKESWDKFGISDCLVDKGFEENQSIAEVNHMICFRRIQVESLRQEHYLSVKALCKQYGIPFLEYSFGMGWDRFCKYTKTTIPKDPLPHLNKS